VHDIVRGYGERLQYSVFLCDLDRAEKIALMTELRDAIHHGVDSVVFIDLGEPERSNAAIIEFMGSPIELPRSGPTIV
jgi:CRISPR-associated protein Cas2